MVKNLKYNNRENPNEENSFAHFERYMKCIEFGPTFCKAWLIASSTIKSNKKYPYRICKHAKVQDFGSLSTHNLFFKSTSINAKVQTKNYIKGKQMKFKLVALNKRKHHMSICHAMISYKV